MTTLLIKITNRQALTFAVLTAAAVIGLVDFSTTLATGEQAGVLRTALEATTLVAALWYAELIMRAQPDPDVPYDWTVDGI